jgi:hypothetical protein
LCLYLFKRRLGNAPDIKKFVAIIALAVATINVGYWFDGSFKLLKDYKFISGALTGNYVERGEEVIQGNRFAGSILGYIPIPFPYEFIRGMDTQKLDFERGFTSYAAGFVSDHGWWWYYGYALIFKESHGILALGMCTLFCLCLSHFSYFKVVLNKYRFKIWDETFILFPAGIFFVFVSLNTGFSEHPRYIIPMLPFVYIFLGRQATMPEFRIWLFVIVVVFSTMMQYPNMISYYNFVSREHKSEYLLGSNIDWGQSVYEIKEWCDTHVEARPRYINYTRSMPFEKMAVTDDGNFPEYERRSGWMIISVNDIRNEKYQWILKEKPVEILGGGSVFIYYLEP